MRTTFDDLPAFPPAFAATRLGVHYATQLVAAAGHTLLPADPDFHASSTTFDVERAAIVGQPLPGGRQVHLVVPDLVLEVAAADGVSSRALAGDTVAGAAAWLGAVLGAPLVFPTWELPAGPVRDYGPIVPDPDALRTFARWLAAADATLRGFAPPSGTPSAVRLWPHHLDIATLVTLRLDPHEPERSRTVGLGLSPGDAGIPFPYLYVTPWPYPTERPTPPLPAGRWNTDGWYGAVLEASEVTDQATVEAFLRAAFDRLG